MFSVDRNAFVDEKKKKINFMMTILFKVKLF